MKVLKIFTLFLISMQLAACENASKQDIGVATGAVAGGLLGSAVGQGTGRVVAVGVGAVAGALIGGAIGKSMDDSDRLQVSHALDSSKPGRSTTWINHTTGTRYTVVTDRVVTMHGNPDCRRYHTVVRTNGRMHRVDSVACRAADGTWHRVD